jgi:hypothetical protein
MAGLTMGDVPGFLPSRNGLHFSNNSWPPEPDITITVPPFGTITIGDASKGLCGGMVFGVLDLFNAGQLPPATTANPADPSPAFNYIVQRLLDSFNIPAGVFQYFSWMQLPTHDDQVNLFGNTITLVTGTSDLTINHSMPTVRSGIDGMHPCPLGLVTVHSTDPTMLGQNHQVLAWGYEDAGSTTTVKVYDPNLPDDDEVTITFDHTDPAHTTTFNYSGSDTILGFFPITWYTPKDPSALGGTTPPPLTGTVPDVLNLSPGAARARIQAAGFTYSASADPIVGNFKPYVESQDPDGGTVAPLEATVYVAIAFAVKGPPR